MQYRFSCDLAFKADLKCTHDDQKSAKPAAMAHCSVYNQ